MKGSFVGRAQMTFSSEPASLKSQEVFACSTSICFCAIRNRTYSCTLMTPKASSKVRESPATSLELTVCRSSDLRSCLSSVRPECGARPVKLEGKRRMPVSSDFPIPPHRTVIIDNRPCGARSSHAIDTFLAVAAVLQ
jgi:hypothetical protein